MIRRRRLDVDGLYEEQGEYSYRGGVNWLAVLAMILAVAPNIPGFLNAALNRTNAIAKSNPDVRALFPEFFDHIYGYAWFIGLGLAMSIYYVLMRGRSPTGGHVARAGATLR